MKRIITCLLIVLMVAGAGMAVADEYYVICRPGAEVNVRERAKLKSPIVACVFFGDKLTSDGKESNGFIHVTGLPAESAEGWIYAGLLVKDQPLAVGGTCQVCNAGRVACRKYADGKVQKWLEDGSNVTLYAVSKDWCVTNYGYIKTEFLTVNAKVW